jgi:hypothetical protein
MASWYGGGCDKDDKLLAVLAAARYKFRFLAQFSQSQRHLLLHAILSATSPNSSRARLPIIIIMPPINFYEYPRLSYLRYDGPRTATTAPYQRKLLQLRPMNPLLSEPELKRHWLNSNLEACHCSEYVATVPLFPSGLFILEHPFAGTSPLLLS